MEDQDFVSMLKQNRVIDTENKQVVARRREVKGAEKEMRETEI